MLIINEIFNLISIALVTIAFLLCLLVILKQKSVFVKIITLEVMGNILLAAIAIWAYWHQSVYFLDICLAIALIMFVSTVAYCQFISTKDKKNDSIIK